MFSAQPPDPISRALRPAPPAFSQVPPPSPSSPSHTAVSNRAPAHRHFQFCKHEYDPTPAGRPRRVGEARSSARSKSEIRTAPESTENERQPRTGSPPTASARSPADSAKQPRPAVTLAAGLEQSIPRYSAPRAKHAP